VDSRAAREPERESRGRGEGEVRPARPLGHREREDKVEVRDDKCVMYVNVYGGAF
jgi:hypothetical protein